jgi:hypothetical protein
MIDQTDKSALEAQRKKDTVIFEEEIKAAQNLYPNHIKKEFTFNALERTLLAEQDTIIALANQAKEHILNRYALGRIGVDFDTNMRIYYSIGLSRFVVLQPKPSIQKSNGKH